MANTLITQLNNPAVLRQYNQRLAAIISLLLVVACAYLLVELTWMFLYPDEESVASVPQIKQSVVNRQAQQNNFKKLTSANIFGISEKAASPKQTKAPETKLNLTLKGVLAAKPMALASAIIAQGKSGKEDIYSVGDRMPGGVLIKEIHPEYVVLERNGQLETLKLQKISGAGGIGSLGLPDNTRNSLSSRSSYSTPGAALNQIRGDILKNPTSFGDYAIPVLVKENGKQIGYRLKPQKNGEVLSKIGLESNDVITEINGVKLDTQQNGVSALRKLSTAKNLNIVVKRNGAEVPLNITLQ